MTPDEEYFHTSPVPPTSLPLPQQLHEEYSHYFQAPVEKEKPLPHMIDRNLVILIFIIGLLLGKAMNPVVLR